MNVSRTRTVAAPVDAVWALVGDPYRLPAWWPRTERVEGVRRDGWTSVLRSERGRAVRADYRVTASETRRRRAWTQAIEGTPFERLLRESAVEVTLAPADGGTAVRVTARQRPRGMARFGWFLLRRALRRQVAEALAALAEVVE